MLIVMILVRLWLVLSLSAAAPVVPTGDNEAREDTASVDIVNGDNIIDIVNGDDIIDIVNGDDINCDALHSHSSENTNRCPRRIYIGGDVSIDIDGHNAQINVASIFGENASQDDPVSPTSSVCTGGEINPAACFCKVGYTKGGNLCDPGQGCNTDGTCVDGVGVRKCFSAEGCPLVQNNLITTLVELKKEFQISFEFQPTQYITGWQNVLFMTTGEKYDKRVALLVKDDGQLYPWFTAKPILTEKKYPIGQWHSVDFSQRLEDTQYFYRVKINGVQVDEVVNKEPNIFSDVKVYASDPWHNALKGSLRNLVITMEKTKGNAGNEEHIYGCGFDDSDLRMIKSTDGSYNVMGRSWYEWKGGKIPYYFKGSIIEGDKKLIQDVMNEIEERTCFQFIQHDIAPMAHHLEIVVETNSCAKGFSASVKPKSLDKTLLHSSFQLTDSKDCKFRGAILHEMMHVFGIMHTHNRNDRDDNIIVHWDDIIDGYESQYKICTECETYDEIPYECDSIMHYGFKTCAKKLNGARTMTAKDSSKCHLSDMGPAFTSMKPTKNDWKLLTIVAGQVCEAKSGNHTLGITIQKLKNVVNGVDEELIKDRENLETNEEYILNYLSAATEHLKRYCISKNEDCTSKQIEYGDEIERIIGAMNENITGNEEFGKEFLTNLKEKLEELDGAATEAQQSFKQQTVISDLKPTVESSKDFGYDYRGSLLLENSCEGNNPSNYWLSPDEKIGEEASIILNLGRVAQFNRFNIKNTHNGESNDRGAKNIGLYTSNSKNGPWKLVAEKLMADARNKGCNFPVEEVTIGTTEAQFIKLVINSYYGYGGGLQYLGVDRVSVCTVDEFSCSSGECVSSEFRCDDTQDCADGSDEINCYKSDWVDFLGVVCWDTTGADNAGTLKDLTVKQCKKACKDDAQCQGIIRFSKDSFGKGSCTKAKNFKMDMCPQDSEYDTYVLGSLHTSLRYLRVPGFKKCLGTKSLGSSSVWCFPSEKPAACNPTSWEKLMTLQKLPTERIKLCG